MNTETKQILAYPWNALKGSIGEAEDYNFFSATEECV